MKVLEFLKNFNHIDWKLNTGIYFGIQGFQILLNNLIKCDMQWALRVDFDGCLGLGRNFKKGNSMYAWHARNQCEDDEWHRGLRRI